MITRVAFALVLLTATAQAADIVVISPETDTATAVVMVTGEIKDHEADTFDTVTKGIERAVVYLNSNGGNARGGLMLGGSILSQAVQHRDRGSQYLPLGVRVRVAWKQEPLHRLLWHRRLSRALPQEAARHELDTREVGGGPE